MGYDAVSRRQVEVGRQVVGGRWRSTRGVRGGRKRWIPRLDPESEDRSSLEGRAHRHRPGACRDSRGRDRSEQLDSTFWKRGLAGRTRRRRGNPISFNLRARHAPRPTSHAVAEPLAISSARTIAIAQPIAARGARSTAFRSVRRPRESVGLQLLQRRVHLQTPVHFLHLLRLHRRLLVEH